MLRQQTRASEYVREGVEKNKVSVVKLARSTKVTSMIFSGDCRPGEPDHGAEQRDGRVEGGEQRQPQCDQQAERQPSRDNY